MFQTQLKNKKSIRQPFDAFLHLTYYMQLEQLIYECKKESITAQQYLFSKYAKQFFILCRRYLKTNEHAEECMMNGFFKLFSAVKKIEFINDAATESWMRKIMLNECLMELRKKNSFLIVAEEEADNLVVTEVSESNLTANEIFELITQLPIGYRTIFNLFVFEELSHKEIATTLNISEGTSKSQLSKARKMLQQLIEQKNTLHANREAR